MKQTKKQIKAQCMNELQGRFDRMNASILAENKRLHQTVNELRDENRALSKEKRDLKNRNEVLQEKLSQYEDWIARLQDFCNLPDGEREAAYKEYMDSLKQKTSANKQFVAMESFYNRIFGMMMN